jgi:HTH-type transcriptional regulator/antitoxin HigA
MAHSMEIKIIRSEDEHLGYLEKVQKILSKGDSLSREETDQLELLSVLIESYENSKYPIEPPDPVDAILFRMEEKGLKQADLIPYFGTSSRVSEVLKRKRPLTVQMIRAVSLGLGISAETLLGLTQLESARESESVDWAKFPIKEMMRRGWLQEVMQSKRGGAEDLVKRYISDAGLQFGAAAFRRTLSGDADSPTTRYSLYAWLARVIQRAREKKAEIAKFEESLVSASFLRELAQLSWSDQGPLLAIEYLQKRGVAVVIEPHLKGTRLDGAALKDIDGTPIIGLTLRFDRLDNFWFTLLHETAHLWKHVTNTLETFLDDLNITSEDRREAEANRLAREAFIPRMIWRRSEAYTLPSKQSIERLSKELRIHPAIIVGQLHKDTGNYRLFTDLLGHSSVRKMLNQEPM